MDRGKRTVIKIISCIDAPRFKRDAMVKTKTPPNRKDIIIAITKTYTVSRSRIMKILVEDTPEALRTPNSVAEYLICNRYIYEPRTSFYSLGLSICLP